MAADVFIALSSIAICFALAWLISSLHRLLKRRYGFRMERVALAIDSANIGIWDWKMDQNDFILCDAGIHRLYGIKYSEDQKPIEFWAKHLHEDDRDRVVRELHDAIEGKNTYNTEFRVVWDDDSIHYLRGTGKVNRGSSGRAVRMVGTNWDVTEARELTAKLAEQHELLRVTLQSISEGVIIKDASRNVIWMNTVAERLTGWSTAEVIGQPVATIFNAIDEGTRLAVDMSVAFFPVKHGVADWTEPTLLIARGGNECIIESTVSPLYGANGDTLGRVLIFRDFTEQRRFAAQTEQTDSLQLELKLKDDFLSHVSHELRSPLTSIYSFSSIIADNLAGETTALQQDYLQIVLKNVDQLQSMIEDLLTVTQSKEGKISIDLQNVSAKEAIVDAVHTIQGVAWTKRIELAVGNVDQHLDVCADPMRLRQILIILLSNAVKFTPERGSISIQVSDEEPGFLLFQVTDTGCGISIKNRTRVFEKLYQVTGPNLSDTSSAGRTGLGLGLYIARDLVARQGGSIWVTGDPDQGSTFNFTLPSYIEASTGSGVAIPQRRSTDLLQERPQPCSQALEADRL